MRNTASRRWVTRRTGVFGPLPARISPTDEATSRSAASTTRGRGCSSGTATSFASHCLKVIARRPRNLASASIRTSAIRPSARTAFQSSPAVSLASCFRPSKRSMFPSRVSPMRMQTVFPVRSATSIHSLVVRRGCRTAFSIQTVFRFASTRMAT